MSYPPKNLPARAPVAATRGGRTRFESSANPRDVRRPLGPDQRSRATTIAGPAPSLARIQAISAQPGIDEMKKGMLFGVEKTVGQFSGINRQTQDFSNTWAEYAVKFKDSPKSKSPVNPNSPVARPASEFATPEEYAFFCLLSIINAHLYNYIFRPFHPAASTQQNSMFEQGYQKQVETALQIIVAHWRSKAFGTIESSINATQKATLLRGIASSIRQAWLNALDALPGDPPPLPPAFMVEIEIILNKAYEWNRVVKMEVAKYDFQPFAAAPFSPYDPAKMEPFELRRSVQTGGRIVSCVSLGLVGNIALGGGRRESHVQHKTRVLVEEWFFATKKTPITQQPRAKPPMTPSAHPSHSMPRAQDPPPPQTKKGCCG